MHINYGWMVTGRLVWLLTYEMNHAIYRDLLTYFTHTHDRCPIVSSEPVIYSTAFAGYINVTS